MINPGLTHPVCTMKTARAVYHRKEATGPGTQGLGVNRAQLSHGFHHAGSETACRSEARTPPLLVRRVLRRARRRFPA